DLGQPFLRIAELLQANAVPVEQRQIQAAHLAVRPAEVVENPAAPHLSPSAPKQNAGQVGGVVTTVQHARAEQKNRIIESRPFTFLNGVEFACEIRQLLDEELIDPQIVGVITVREFVVADLDPQMGKLEVAVVVVQLQGADACRIRLECKHED